MKVIRKLITYLFVGLILILVVMLLLTISDKPKEIKYGTSFNTLYAEELELDPREVYIAVLDDLGVKRLRLSAHWTMVEPTKDRFNFKELDFQLKEAESRGVDVILGVGRRLPRWPECHVPDWAQKLTWEEQKKEIKELITEIVLRYKDSRAITHWQVENEPFLEIFAKEECGELDKEFLAEEIALVKELDHSRPILITDSGNLGSWFGAYRSGDVFGTSVYIYFWNPEVGQFKSILPPSFYRAKNNLMRILYGNKQTFLIELSAEPWLMQPIIDTPIETQLERMDIEKFKEIIEFAKDTRFSTQYLWGAEWWYWLKKQGDESFWVEAEKLFDTE